MAKFIEYKKFSAKENMSIDQSLLDDCIQSDPGPILRLYGWRKPSVTIGRNQPIKDINKNFCKQNNIEIVKRPTGGRAVLHYNELTYAFICNSEILENGKSIIQSYKEISEALILGFKQPGIELEFPPHRHSGKQSEVRISLSNSYCMALSTGADLSYKGKKLIGSAQYRKQGYILQHGSIIFDIDKVLVENIFGEDDVSKSQITLKEINPDISIEELANSIKSGFEKQLNVEFKN